MKRGLLLVVAVSLWAGGCGKKEDAPPAVSPPPGVQVEPSKTAVVPPPPPRIDTAKGAEVDLPKPGQANDHSNPEFKGGGEPDRKK